MPVQLSVALVRGLPATGPPRVRERPLLVADDAAAPGAVTQFTHLPRDRTQDPQQAYYHLGGVAAARHSLHHQDLLSLRVCTLRAAALLLHQQ